jgi:lincosamide nucleotidyltransferase B/F
MKISSLTVWFMQDSNGCDRDDPRTNWFGAPTGRLEMIRAIAGAMAREKVLSLPRTQTQEGPVHCEEFRSTMHKLLQRLDEIAQSLEQSEHALALIGLGSVGLELERLDAHSDLDFFVILEAGFKSAYLENLSWLTELAPVAYQFQNTGDGFKLLFADDVFCEFAIFEAHELERIQFAAGRIVWKKPGVSESIGTPNLELPASSSHGLEWLLGEALTNLYIGLKRFNRGEKLSAARFVQQYALDRVLDLAARLEPEQNALKDPFNHERRLEQRFPQLAGRLADFIQGYERTPESALAMLEFLETHVAVNQAIAAAIRKLAAET